MFGILFSGIGTELIKKFFSLFSAKKKEDCTINVEIKNTIDSDSIKTDFDTESEASNVTETFIPRKLELASRLQQVIQLIKLGIDCNDFTITKIAQLLGYELVTPFERYVQGESEPSVDELKRINAKFGVNFNWLNNGVGHPFYSDAPYQMFPMGHLKYILEQEPQDIYFIQSDNTEKSSTILLRIDTYRYKLLMGSWHISEHVGATGERQIYSYYKLIRALKLHPKIGYSRLWGKIISDFDDDLLVSGDIFPGQILKKYKGENSWWDDLLDINHECSHFDYASMYGESFLCAQRVIKLFLKNDKEL